MNDNDLRTRVRNPNKEFDSFFWRPKNKLVRTFVNKYINIIEIAGYAFGATMLAGIIYAWFVRHDEWTGWVTTKLKPSSQEVRAAARSAVDSLYVVNRSSVEAGDTIALLRVGPQTVHVLRAPAAGLCALTPDTLKKGAAVDSNAVVATVYDFAKYRCDVELTGSNVDSVSVGDTVRLIVDRECDQDFLINAHLPDTSMSLEYVTLRPAEFNTFMDSVKALLKGRSITAQQQGVYTVDNVGTPEVIVEAKLKPAPGGAGAANRTFYGRPFAGVVTTGTRYLSVDMTKPLPDSVIARLRKWVADSLLGAGLQVDGKPYAVEEISLLSVKAIALNASAPMEGYVPFRQRPKRMKEYPIKSFKVKAVVDVASPPPHIAELARTFFVARGEFLDVRLRVCSYRISWGQKLVRKK